tara:strand:- start:7339 stop:8556 length:1218 start_codon:yes stop_codon:yes gene_type:complete
VAYRNLIAFFLLGLFPALGFAQSDSYNLDIYPDLWYNSVDGARVGGFVLGEMEGEFQSGPHRLDAGVWLGTNFPDLPVSYYISLTEPIKPFTMPVNEANFRVESSIRTGLSRHKISFNKRWQPGFNELNFLRVGISFSREKMFDSEYRPFPLLWENQWKSLAGADLQFSQNLTPGRFMLKSSITQNLNADLFTVADVEITQTFELYKGFYIDVRGFAGYVSEYARPEYYYGRSYRPAAEWLDKGISRSKGTIPQSLVEDGLVHMSGGANLRGYTQQDFENPATMPNTNFDFVSSLNVEFEFPNPVNSLFKGSIVESFVSFRSYIFGDAGTFSRKNYGVHNLSDYKGQFADAGIGFQFFVNIPDYLGKDRGFALRYEIPFWLSDPAMDENNFKFRNLIGIGAVISL